MAITTEHAGRTFPPTAPYRVNAEKIAEFAAALGDDNPAYRGDDAIAPPTMVAMISARAWDVLFDDPELELSLSRTIHVDQRFDHVRPLAAGDEVTCSLTLDKVRVRGQVDMITLSVAVTDADDQQVCTATSNLFHTREEAA